jgi:SmpA / OmlA family
MKPAWTRPAWLRSLALLGVVLLAGCAVPQWTQPGTPRAEIIARLGPPTATYALPEGERLQYSQQPAGTQVHNFDLDASGRLRSIDQALEPEKFTRIVVDRWTARDVEYLLGRPGLVERVARFDGEVWTYRYHEFSGFRRLHVHLDRAGVVRQWLTTDEPRREFRDWPP